MKSIKILSSIVLLPAVLLSLAGCNNTNNEKEEPQKIVINYFDSQRIANVTSIQISDESIVKYEGNALVPQEVGTTTALINGLGGTIVTGSGTTSIPVRTEPSTIPPKSPWASSPSFRRTRF